jgi:general stress protein 26
MAHFSAPDRMKTGTQPTPELARLCKMIEHLPVAMMTINADGALLSRPMAPLEMDAQGALWFFTDLRSATLEHLRAINLSFTDPAQATFVSLSGRGELSTDRSHIERLWAPFARPWFPHGSNATNLALLRFVPVTAEYWDGAHSKMVRMFALAASVVAGRRIGMGEHGIVSGLSPAPPPPSSAPARSPPAIAP